MATEINEMGEESRNIRETEGRALLPNKADEMRISIKDDRQLPQTLQSPSSNLTQDHWPASKCFFSDGRRRIDYVLAYSLDNGESTSENGESALETPRTVGSQDGLSSEEKKRIKRETFQAMLENQGLQLEIVDGRHSRTRFVLVHAPWEVMAKQAEFLRVKMPIRVNDVKNENPIIGCFDKILQKVDAFELEEKYDLKEPDYFTAFFSAERADQFIMPPDGDKSRFFSSSQRSWMVYDLLIRTLYDPGRKDRVGIERLLTNGTYSAAFPLHDGDYWLHKSLRRTREDDQGQTIFIKENNRQLLYDTWAKTTRFYKYQPLPLIRKYFGTKIGLYFAWLGYYTKVLTPAAIVGLLCVIYGAITLSTDPASNDLCNKDSAGGIIMCPNCDKICQFWQLIDSCRYAKLTHIFDNFATVIFAAFMSVWATLFLEGWKRYHAEVAWEWDLMDYEVEEETIRPEFQIRVRSKRVNPVTQEEEPYLPVRQKIMRFIMSGVSVLFFLLLVVAFVFGVVVYRVIVVYVMHASEDDFTQKNAPILTSVTAALLNLIVILLLSWVYTGLAWQLTDWECPRTQTEWENSYTFKVFLFQFINYYSSLFYIAFFKGKFSGVPGAVDEDREQGKYRVFGYRLESCDPAGCMVELVIQLAIIMVGKQFFSGFVEIGMPMCMNAFRNWRHHLPGTKKQKMERRQKTERAKRSVDETDQSVPRWERDYALNAVPEQFLFDEYLEMVIQFGFVTLFVAAFPLAPLFALLNNIMEIRLDAYKFVVASRRPMPARAKNIGVWTSILDGVSKMAVLTNACVIAFTSDFVPKMLYMITEGNGSLANYVNDSLSYYNASKLEVDMDDPLQNSTVCRFRDYRKPPCSLKAFVPALADVADCDDHYGFSLQWWHVFAAKLAFVLVFEHLVFLIKGFVAYIIPDLPTHIFIKLQREQYLARQARRDYEFRPKSAHDGDDNGALAAVNVKEKYAAFRNEAAAAFQPGAFDTGDETRLRDVGGIKAGVRQRSSTRMSNDSFHSVISPSDSHIELSGSDAMSETKF